MPNKIAFVRCGWHRETIDGQLTNVSYIEDHNVKTMVLSSNTRYPDDGIFMVRVDSGDIGAIRTDPNIEVLHTAPEIDEDESEDAPHWQSQLWGWLENSQSPDAQVVRDAFEDVLNG